jgi:hypothetical protein
VLVAPAVVPLAITVEIAWESISASGLAGLQDAAYAAILVFAFGLPISYAIMLVFGLPYVLWLRSRNRLSWAPVYTGATLLGAALWVGFWQQSMHPPALFTRLLSGAILGLLVGVVFCWAARCGPHGGIGESN